MNKNKGTRINPEYLKSLGEMKQTIVLPQESNLTREQCKKIIALAASQLGVSEDEALTIIGIFLQKGATSKGYNGNATLSIFGKELKLSKVRKVFAECNCKNGLRKFARTYATEIYEIAKAVGVPGNLYKRLGSLIEEETEEDQYWLSDFQSDNDEAPRIVRDLIKSHFRKREKKQ
jgi:hypothetical protein